MNTRKIAAALSLALALAFVAPSAQAKGVGFISSIVSWVFPKAPAPVLKSFTGSVTITKADKTVVTLKAGDPIPALAPGDSINVVSGDAVVSVGSNEVAAKTGANVSVTASSFQVVSGNATTLGGAPLVSGVNVSANSLLMMYVVIPAPKFPTFPTFNPHSYNFPPPAPPTQQKNVVSPSAPF
ncbi:MAG: hypothetical protein ACHQ51_06640 [Elusimicrobiota bacterium]